MTISDNKKILMGLSMATLLFTVGLSSQSFAMPMTNNIFADKTQSEILVDSGGNLFINGTQYELVGIPSTHSGGTATFELIPQPSPNPMDSVS